METPLGRLEPRPIAEVPEKPRILASAWRYSWILGLALVLGGAGGYFGALTQPTMYAATARVLLPDLSTGPDAAAGSDPARNLLNQAAIMSSTPVLGEAARRAGNRLDVDTVRRRVSVQAAPDTDAISVRALDPTAAGAAKLADSVVSAYTAVIDGDAHRAATQEVNRIKAGEQALEGRIADLRSRLADNARDTSARADLDASTAQLQNLITQELKAAAQVDRPSDLIGLREDAEVAHTPVQPKPLRYAAVGALAGLALGLILACWLDRRRHTRRLADYRESLAELPALGTETTAELLAGGLPGAEKPAGRR